MSAKCRRLKDEHSLDLVVVDYLQLMSGDRRSENRVQEVSYISRQLKIMARELDVPVLAAAQLSRAVEQRQDRQPILSDLRESGSLEQDADIVMFINRPNKDDQDSLIRIWQRSQLPTREMVLCTPPGSRWCLLKGLPSSKT